MMARSSARQSGGAAWRAALERKGIAVDAATRQATTRSIHIVERAVKRTLRTYTHPEGTPTPAPPGGPPALVTGTLARSQRVTPTGRAGGRGRWKAKTGPTVAYGRAQELGYRPGNLPARPYQKPTTRRQLATIRATYRAAWGEALRA